MVLDSNDVSRIALLARLELGPAEQAEMLTQLNGFFDIVEQMRAVDTAGVAPLYTPLSAFEDVALRLRDDAVTEAIDREANQRSAPAVEEGFFLVPRVIE
jgi:aspartyl-tRNA(Asn)/glutamyl-tRNA(Gln) amidotransferase subunit C